MYLPQWKHWLNNKENLEGTKKIKPKFIYEFHTPLNSINWKCNFSFPALLSLALTLFFFLVWKQWKKKNCLLTSKDFSFLLSLETFFQVIKEYLALNDFSMKKSILRKGTLASYQFAYLGEKETKENQNLDNKKPCVDSNRHASCVFTVCE